MALVEQRPAVLSEDRSQKIDLRFVSPADGTPQQAVLFAPEEVGGKPLPLVLAPHAITWTPEQEYSGGLEGLKRGFHKGWYGLPDKYDVLIVIPHGHHYRETGCSCAGAAQIEDMAHLIDYLPEHGFPVDERRVYTCGLSMGGHEALVLAGRYPEKVAGAVAFNPIVDLGAWQYDLVHSKSEEIRSYGTGQRIANEVGGQPEDALELYAERNAMTYADKLAQVPICLFWSERDLVVPRQITHHAYALYQKVKSAGVTSPISEFNHTRSHGAIEDDDHTNWQLHEWCDYELALQWLLAQEKDRGRPDGNLYPIK